jgi:hypothetical protein
MTTFGVVVLAALVYILRPESGSPYSLHLPALRYSGRPPAFLWAF